MTFDYTIQSKYSFETTIHRLTESLKSADFGVLWKMDLKEKLQSNSLEFQDEFQILEICNPVEAHRVLLQDIRAGYFLPCKMLVYTKDERVYVGMPKPTALIEMTNNDELTQIARDIESRLKAAMNRIQL